MKIINIHHEGEKFTLLQHLEKKGVLTSKVLERLQVELAKIFE